MPLPLSPGFEYECPTLTEAVNFIKQVRVEPVLLQPANYILATSHVRGLYPYAMIYRNLPQLRVMNGQAHRSDDLAIGFYYEIPNTSINSHIIIQSSTKPNKCQLLVRYGDGSNLVNDYDQALVDQAIIAIHQAQANAALAVVMALVTAMPLSPPASLSPQPGGTSCDFCGQKRDNVVPTYGGRKICKECSG